MSFTTNIESLPKRWLAWIIIGLMGAMCISLWFNGRFTSKITQLTQERDSICETCLLIVQDTATGVVYLYGEQYPIKEGTE